MDPSEVDAPIDSPHGLVHRHGPSLLVALAAVANCNDPEAQALARVDDPAQVAADAARQLRPAGGRLCLEVLGDGVSIDGERPRVGARAAVALAALLRARGIGRVLLQVPLLAADVRTLGLAVRGPSDATAASLAAVRARLAAAGAAILVEATGAVDASDDGRTWLIPSLRAYLRTAAALREARRCEGARAPVPVRHGKRALQAMIEMVQKDERAVLALLAVPGVAEDWLVRRTNAALLALVLGHRLELAPKALSELGLAALFLDLAPASLLRAECAGDSTVLCLRLALEQGGRGPRSLLGDIVAVCDAFSAATSTATGRASRLSAASALGALLQGHDGQLDLAVVKLLVQELGAYPPGTLVQLDTGEFGAVRRSGADPALLDRPVVMLLAGADGAPRSELVDLRERDERGAFRRSVARVLDAGEVGLSRDEHLAVL